MKEIFRRIDRKLLLFTLIGLFVGIAVFAASAKTLKATDQAEFCSTCHVMDTAFQTFSESNHATLSCNDCHAPTDSFTSKLMFKAKAGMGHMYMNTIGASKIPDVLHATAASKDVINENCMSCHEPTMQNVEHDAKDSCIDCHRQVPHMKGSFKSQDWHEPQQFDFKK